MNQTLLSILASVDALFSPYRGPRGSVGRAGASDLRRRYREFGLPWGMGGNDRDRKAGQRELNELERSGRLVINRAGGKAVHVRLSDSEDDAMRKAVCLDTFHTSLDLLDHFGELIEKGFGYESQKCTWIRETTLWNSAIDAPMDNPTDGKDLGRLEEWAFPLLVRGLLVSNSDLEGRAWYSMTPAGVSLLGRAKDKAKVLSAPRNPSESRRAYLDYFNNFRSDLTSLEPETPGEIGPVPMPAGVSDQPKGTA